MAFTVGNTEYNGGFLEFLYLVFDVGNEVVEKGATRTLVGVAKKKALPKLSQTERPFGAYTSGVPAAESVTTTYAEKSIEPLPMTLYETFLPEDFLDVWEKWQSVDDFTNLRMNPEFMADVITLYNQNGGKQLSELFFQGDTGLAASSGLARFDGIVTQAIADAGVINPAPLGVITKVNVVDVLESVYNAIPDKFIEDPDWKIRMNMTDFRLLQQANIDAKKTTTGVLSTNIEYLFLNQKIEAYSTMPKNYIIGYKALPASDESNVFMAYWVEFTNENPRINYVANAGRNMFIRIDLKAAAAYRVAEEIVQYEPA